MKPLKTALRKRAYRQWMLWWILPFILVAGGWYPILGFFIPFCMVVGIGIALFKGRLWCDWLCPRGSSLDRVLSPVSRRRPIPAFFRTTAFRVGVMLVLMGVLGTQLPRFWPDLEGMGRVFIIMLTLTTSAGVVLGVLTHHRNWCTYCPVGTLGKWLGRGKYPLTITAACSACTACDRVCPIQVKRWEYRPEQGSVVVPEWDCLKCGLCVAACPEKALALDKT